MYIVRHGETELNIKKAFQGHTDSALTSKGIEQAKDNADIIKHQKQQPTHIISSDLPRAVATAEIISEILNIPVQTDDKLREVYFGFWDGMADEDIQSQFPELWENRVQNKWSFNDYDGESYKMAHNRAQEWLAKHYSENILVVSHRSFGKILRGAYKGLSPESIMQTDFLHTDIFKLSNDGINQIS